MHVASEEGLYSFRKSALSAAELAAAGSSGDPVPVCGLYMVADPDRTIEMTVKYMNVACDAGGMMGVRLLFDAIKINIF